MSTKLVSFVTWRVNLVKVDGSVDGIVDDVGVIVQAQVTQHLYTGRQGGNWVGLAGSNQMLQSHQKFIFNPFEIRTPEI